MRLSQLSKAERFIPISGVYPKGFFVREIHCGVKKSTSLSDLEILRNNLKNDAVPAACFTKNKFKAAAVQVSSQIHPNMSSINSIVVNSGNANAVTGVPGLKDTRDTVRATDSVLENKDAYTLYMSTGVNRNNLPIDKILLGIPMLALNNLGSNHQHWLASAKAICTADTIPELVSKNFSVNGHDYTLAGLPKGAGMICPNMATILGFFVTDAPVTSKDLSKILKYAVDRSFNSVSVDSYSSTNDTTIAIANGAAGGP